MREELSSVRTGWPSIALLAISLIGMGAALRWYYTNQRAAMEMASIRELSAVADFEKEQIAEWREDRRADGRVLMAAPSLRTVAKRLSGIPTSAEEREAVLGVATTMVREFGYRSILVVDSKGTVRTRLAGENADEVQLSQSGLADLCMQAINAHDAVLSSLEEYTGKRQSIWLTVPVGRVGAIIIEIDAFDFLYPFIKSWPGPSRTGEAMLVRLDQSDVVYLSERRYASGLPGRRRLRFRLPPDSAMDSGFVLRGADYRGVNVLMQARHIPNSPWYVAVKIDAAEVSAPIVRLGRELTSILLILALAFVAGIALMEKHQQLRIHHVSEQRFRAIADDTPAYLWMATPGEKTAFVNKTLQKFLGAASQSLPDWTQFVHPEDIEHAMSEFEEAMTKATPYKLIVRVRRFDGQHRVCISEGLPRFSPQGVFSGFVGSLMDITEQKDAEQNLMAANTALGRGLAERIRGEEEIRALSARLISAQEDERTKLSRELHDDVSQQIAALNFATGNLKRNIPEEQAEVRDQTDQIQRKLVDLAESIRRLSHELQPATLKHSGLAVAVREYCQEFETLTGIRVILRADGEFSEIPPQVALNAYRIIQEALGNVAKHANAEMAEIDLLKSRCSLMVAVTDHGVGFRADKSDSPGGLGLINIRERARALDAGMSVQSSPGLGTVVSIEIPLRTASGATQSAAIDPGESLDSRREIERAL